MISHIIFTYHQHSDFCLDCQAGSLPQWGVWAVGLLLSWCTARQGAGKEVLWEIVWVGQKQRPIGSCVVWYAHWWWQGGLGYIQALHMSHWCFIPVSYFSYITMYNYVKFFTFEIFPWGIDNVVKSQNLEW